jgi:hypothetical protein
LIFSTTAANLRFNLGAAHRRLPLNLHAGKSVQILSARTISCR